VRGERREGASGVGTRRGRRDGGERREGASGVGILEVVDDSFDALGELGDVEVDE